MKQYLIDEFTKLLPNNIKEDDDVCRLWGRLLSKVSTTFVWIPPPGDDIFPSPMGTFQLCSNFLMGECPKLQKVVVLMSPSWEDDAFKPAPFVKILVKNLHPNLRILIMKEFIVSDANLRAMVKSMPNLT